MILKIINSCDEWKSYNVIEDPPVTHINKEELIQKIKGRYK